MKPYGQHRKHHGCCPGHDKFTSDKNPTRASAQTYSHNNKLMHRAERRRQKVNVKKDVE